MVDLDTVIKNRQHPQLRDTLGRLLNELQDAGLEVDPARIEDSTDIVGYYVICHGDTRMGYLQYQDTCHPAFQVYSLSKVYVKVQIVEDQVTIHKWDILGLIMGD